MRPTLALLAAATALPALAQNVTVFPADYVNVTDGPNNSPNLPLANGIGRFLCLYESWDLAIPAGRQINRLGFREDTATTIQNAGHSLQLEIRMGYSSQTATNMSTTFATNYATTPVTVFGPALYALPALRNPSAPLTNHMFWIDLTTPFTYDPTQGNLLVEYRVFGNTNGGNSFTYYLDRAGAYSPVNNGPAGCQHSGSQVPALTVNELTSPGQFSASSSNSPANAIAVLMLSPGGRLITPYSLAAAAPGIQATCMGQIPLQGAQPLLTFASGTFASWSFNLPNDRVLFNDMWLACQVAYFDFFAPGGVVVSNGAEVQVGVNPYATILTGAGVPTVVTTGNPIARYCPVAFFGHN